ncbi:ParA family protein [Deinococcus sp. QL22]|uniref:ParA family protein n=1 Tax=Deinococcus sp. QL22 TaxID=2939437 RepID=UPI0020182ABC|nr:ParA family protein [Deinococcus sp. QL22]UQN09396.1 ParA family protein [Deinococcus sp. QL22]
MRVYGITNVKGGAGKTHASIHLAYEAARLGKRVAVLDLDPTRQSVNWVELAGLGLPALHLDIKQSDLEAYIEQLRADGDFDVIVIDTPANDRDAALETLMVADVAIIPVGVGTSDTGMLGTTERQVKRALQLRPHLKTFILLNRTKFAPARERETEEECRKTGIPVLQARVPLRGDYQAAAGKVPKGEHYGDVWREINA